MTIKPATNIDIRALVSLVNSAYRGEASKKGWTTEANLLEGSLRTDIDTMNHQINEQDAVILKCSNNEQIIVGCVFLKKKESGMYLGMLSVSPDYQANGIGKQLLAAAIEHAKKNECSAIYMTVISVRHELITWYERHGYKKTGEKKPFPTDIQFGIPTQPLEVIVLEKRI